MTVGSANVTFTNLATKPTPIAADKLLLRDSEDSNKLKLVAFSSVGAAKFIYSEQIVKPVATPQTSNLSAGGYVTLQQSGSTSDWTYTWTPRAVGNKALIKVSVPAYVGNGTIVYVGIVDGASTVIGVGGAQVNGSNQVVVNAECTFTSTSATHTFKIWVGSSQPQSFGDVLQIAKNDSTSSWFNNDGTTTQNAKVQFELIEF